MFSGERKKKGTGVGLLHRTSGLSLLSGSDVNNNIGGAERTQVSTIVRA